ncbi:MAG: DUF438 domain-containing protein [Candidatus Marinimicrobia bacterium]|nr:DUF438 domain-containing protein [Candidatus Neomarinimicrobiota bacterium]
MSKIIKTSNKRIQNLTQYIQGLIDQKNGRALLEKFKIQTIVFKPMEVMIALENIMMAGNDMEIIKTATNKLFNILYNNLVSSIKNDFTAIPFLERLSLDNAGVKAQLAESTGLIKALNHSPNTQVKDKLIGVFEALLRFSEHYIVMQNIVFPEIEKRIENHGCLKIMWSFHDDIIQNIKINLAMLQGPDLDISRFNVVSGKVYFNINSLAFREEYILFPIMVSLIEKNRFEMMDDPLKDFRLEYFDASKVLPENRKKEGPARMDNLIELSTGRLDLERLEMIFSHLPVDITYVNEQDEVQFFSNPRQRIFPRTTSIIGRKVQNCHPHESVHIVNQIIEAFRKGEKDEAAFWIKMGPAYVLIKYFAVRNADHQYKGVLEVTQEISDIQKISGERRLLDW